MKNELRVIVGDLQRRYDLLDTDQKRKLRLVTARVLFVGAAVTVTGAFYPFIPIIIRVFALPVIVVGSWFLAGKLASGSWSQISEKHLALGRLINRLKNAPTLAVLGALMMVAFLLSGLIWGSR